MHLSRDLQEFVASLNAHDVRYLVVGGYAVAAHGHPRYTRDLDVWIELGDDNAERVLAALRDFGFGELPLTVDDLTRPERVIQLGYPPQRIDLLTSLKGVRFADCYELRMTLQLDGIAVNFIDLDNLKKNKLATGRHQDLADVENLS